MEQSFTMYTYRIEKVDFSIYKRKSMVYPPCTNVVLLHKINENVNVVKTDGIKISYRDLVCEDKGTFEGQIIISSDTFKSLIKFSKEKSREIKVTVDKDSKNVIFSSGKNEESFSCENIEMSYPNYTMILNEVFKRTPKASFLVFEDNIVSRLKNIITEANKVKKKDKSKRLTDYDCYGLRLSIADKIVTAEVPLLNSGKFEIGEKIDGKNMNITLHAIHLYNLLKPAIDDKPFIFSIGEITRPVLIRINRDMESWAGVLMPMRD